MTPEMVETLYRVSLLYAPEPETIYRQIVEAVAQTYGGTMAMMNLVEGNCLRFRTVVNVHPAFAQITTLEMQATLCQFALRSMRPLLIQNAQTHPDFCNHPVVDLRLRRYLGVPISNSGGETVGTLCFLDDRVEEILGEEDIRFLSLLAMRVSSELERERMIEARIAEQRAYAEQLKATAEEKRQFMAMVLHDLRHPLTTMRTALYLLRLETDAAQRSAHLDALEKRACALGTLLDELVMYDQIEAGRPSLHLSEVDPAALIPSCIEEVVGLMCEQTVPVYCEIAPDLGTLYFDAGKLKHILLNLIANALKFTLEGQVTVRAFREDVDHWRLEVEDTGVGMTAMEQQRAFEAYFSGANAGGGAGLGLAITQRLCKALQGQVTLRSAPGEGACFRLRFPCRLEPDQANATPERPSEEARSLPTSARQESIL